MTQRYTKKDATKAFDGLMQFLNKKHTKFDHNNEVGSWYLDYNTTYGGAVIHEVVNEGYGVKALGNRMKPYEFCQAVRLFYEINNSK